MANPENTSDDDDVNSGEDSTTIGTMKPRDSFSPGLRLFPVVRNAKEKLEKLLLNIDRCPSSTEKLFEQLLKFLKQYPNLVHSHGEKALKLALKKATNSVVLELFEKGARIQSRPENKSFLNTLEFVLNNSPNPPSYANILRLAADTPRLVRR